MGVRRIAAALLVVGLLAIPVGAQYGWFTLDGGLIARLSSSTTAVTIRQDGSGAVLDLYAGTTRIFRAISTGFSWALAQTIDVASIGTTSTDGMRVRNQTAAAAGAQQYSPRTCWEGQGWKTDATAASQSVVFCLETQPVQGTSAPTGNLILKASINGGAFSTVGTFTNGGQWLAPVGTAAAPSITFAGDTDTGWSHPGANIIDESLGGVAKRRITATAMSLSSDVALAWHSTINEGGGIDDLILVRDAANTLALRNGANEQGFRVGPSATYTQIQSAAWGGLLSPPSVSVANDATVTLGTASLGQLVVTIGTTNTVCRFTLRGSSNAVLVDDDGDTGGGAVCTITKDNASTLNVYFDTTGYFLQNKLGGTRAVRLALIGA